VKREGDRGWGIGLAAGVGCVPMLEELGYTPAVFRKSVERRECKGVVKHSLCKE